MLSKKEAFKMVLDKIFDDDSDSDLQEVVYDYFKVPTELTVSTNPKPTKKSTSKKSTPKQVTSKKIGDKPPKGKYEFAETYRKQLSWKLFDDGTVGNTTYKHGQFESYQVLNVFEKCKIPFSNEEYSKNVDILIKNGFNQVTGMRFLYSLQNEITTWSGELLDIIYEIYCNKYDVPPYTLFGVQNNQITVNNVETGIKPFQIKQWIDEIKSSGDEKGIICKIMKENTDVSKKYLFTLLKNYEDKSLLELL